MDQPWGSSYLGFSEHRFLQENVRAELADARKYTEQARFTDNPALRRLWLHLAEEERRHAAAQQRLLRAAAMGDPLAEYWF